MFPTNVNVAYFLLLTLKASLTFLLLSPYPEGKSYIHVFRPWGRVLWVSWGLLTFPGNIPGQRQTLGNRKHRTLVGYRKVG